MVFIDYQKYLYQKAVDKLKAKEWETGIAILTRSLQIYSKNLKAYRARGVVFMNLKQYYRAIEDFNQVLRFCPNDAFMYSKRCECYGKLGNHQQAEADFHSSERFGKL